MRLLRFRVTNFRSVEDSGWIETDDVTALIGTNESGKTNLLLPLWKLNPAKDGEITPTTDYPRKLFNSYREQKPQPVFVEAIFAPQDDLVEKLVQLTGSPAEAFTEVSVSRRFDGPYLIRFPNAHPVRTASADRVLTILDTARDEITTAAPLKSEQDLKAELLEALASARAHATSTSIARVAIEQIESTLTTAAPAEPAKTSVIVPRYAQAVEAIQGLVTEVSKTAPGEVAEARELIIARIPKFVYYSNYGNLDSEIYLPHVIENLERADLGAKDSAKARTLKVLFEFVRLSPTEILELGRDFEQQRTGRKPTDEEIADIAEKKKQRSILLQSASTELTMRFRDWWKQGEYRFRFEADGNHFRIWVSDAKRPEEIELESRSTGLQWFLSFYLVFLVESQDAHENAILLLDEPGLSLHPLAQRDLSAFFEGLAETNQLLYTTHSPFLVDADHLDRARKVYVAADGTSKATPDLRGGENDVSQRGSSYAVHAALGISVAESLMLGCTPVIVEGPSDQIYLSAIKTLLIASGRLTPGREMVFPPAGGVKGVKAVASVLGSKEDDMPLVLVDSDDAGQKLVKDLRAGLYQGMTERVIEFGDITTLAGAEVEDLIPHDVLVREVDRWFRGPETEFADSVIAGRAVLPQLETWARANGIALELGWKVELAKRVKRVLLNRGPGKIAPETFEVWERLFTALQQREEAPTTSR